MNYKKCVGIIGVVTIALLAACDAWLDDASKCQKFYQAKQFSQAFPVCRKVAEQGNSRAQTNLGWMYEYGKGVKQDDVKAAKWYRKAAEQGYARAQHNLGVMYFTGKSVKQDNVGSSTLSYGN